MKIKICGFTNVDDALFAAEQGADFIGLIFAEKSKRRVTLAAAKQIVEKIRSTAAEPVCVFAEESLEEILSICKELGVSTVQLHGEKAKLAAPHLMDFCRIYAMRPGEKIQPSLDPKRDYLLFDGPSPGSGQTFDHNTFSPPSHFRWFLAGGLTADNVQDALFLRPDGLDVASGVESLPGKKDKAKVRAFLRHKPGYFGPFGGAFIPEILVQPVEELKESFARLRQDAPFLKHLSDLLNHYAGRPTALTEIPRFSERIQGPRIFLKREDLLHTGAHKLNNALGQCLLAKHMGKTRIIAETGAGQHGVATATACAHLGLSCTIYMGKKDIERQKPNVLRMKLLGAEVISVEGGSQTLKDAVNEALRDWAQSYENTHYCLGSALGPHPFPEMVAFFQAVIGKEVKQEFFERFQRHPDAVIACIGGGSNAIGIFSAYLDDPSVRLIGVEGGGKGGLHAARFSGGRPGVLHGTYTYLLQDRVGQILPTHSISAGLDYPAIGPHHAQLHSIKRAEYSSATDDEVLVAFKLLAQTEGIIPALESAHALAYVVREAKNFAPDAMIVVNLSGRGDKDLPQLIEKGLI